MPVFYHTFCTSGAFRLDETSYHELKPYKLQWFLHLRTGPQPRIPQRLPFESRSGSFSGVVKNRRKKSSENCYGTVAFSRKPRPESRKPGGRALGARKWAKPGRKMFLLDRAGHVGCKNWHETGPRASPEAADYINLHSFSRRSNWRRREVAKTIILGRNGRFPGRLFLLFFSGFLGCP